MHILHVLRQVARLPIIVVGVVLELVVEQPIRAFQILRVEIRNVARIQIEPVSVRRAEIKRHCWLRLCRILLRIEERRIESEARRQHEGSAVIPSSPRNRSVIGACGLAATSAGCESMIDAEV